ncbi:alpha-glucosidase C-terminal domain-containing protein [Gilvimarinus agarilyticus]|uniref:alpha-amylase family glycosyl hydrolase n=1 Tax=Gilvimarinus sp. 2_MG-2023 TaxID=3062666 RepID=UPI001C08CE0F|nr:alpha-amylase family glycosyl hydrolase [Gilvimarinus sp. 2_MG-2023]MBU2886955.1 alpha-glucosidase C-terminal domain-containing protein [Gilvimarinus agarilyticus]MDO6571615.1 alpha-amylase family glycosyl hydrolase [Gilvimarinus sp. 2_MG-2023]
MTTDFLSLEELKQKIHVLIAALYPHCNADELTEQCLAAIGPRISKDVVAPERLWSEKDCLLITYGNSIREAGHKPLDTLQHFLHNHLQGVFSAVHILPFFPFSSDDGFAVIDYTQVDPELGDWGDINALAQDFKLMADLVINHVSSQSLWFRNYQYGKDPGRGYFVEADPNDNLSDVVRPRTSPLLRKTDTADGTKHVWCTFSHDQVDVDFRNEKVLLEYLGIIGLYLDEGAQWIRLDAVAFLWKKIGTRCIHLPETHDVIKLVRLLTEYKNAHALLISETNVPNRENLTYFGNSNEAHVIYNFSLPPLVIHALLAGDCTYLKTWMMSMPPSPVGCTYLNFTASHDGIGLRPAEGLLDDGELKQMLTALESFGGRISSRTDAEGNSKPYEANISLFDAFKGTYKGTDQWQVERLISSQSIMLAVEGIPAFYIHTLFATHNDYDKVKTTGHNRSINRCNWSLSDLNERLGKDNGPGQRVFNELQRLIKIRAKQPAFHPNATQFTLHLRPEIFAFWRQSMQRTQSIFCIYNLSDQTQELNLADINLISTENWIDLISGQVIDDLCSTMQLQPYQNLWLTNYVGE